MANNYFDLSGKTALITGASSGLGVHFARVLAQEGAQVVLAARRVNKLEEIVAALRNDGFKADAIEMDVSCPDNVTVAFQQIQQQIGAIDILINNAGVASEPVSFLKVNEKNWNWHMETNLDGAWRVARAASLQMVAAEKPGCIINISSIYGLRTGAMKVAYNVSKAALVQLTKSMSIELCRKNIRVNALCPGWFKTDMNADYFDSESGKRYVQTIPMKRMGQLEDLTVPLLLLASEAGAYMTGATLSVDGGLNEAPV